MTGVLKRDSLSAKDIDDDDLSERMPHANLYKRLKTREQKWWQARQNLTALKERQMFWYGENSLIMWLLWQFVGYVVVAMTLMLLSNFLDIRLPLWQYTGLFVIQTVIFIAILFAKGRLANDLQRKIDEYEWLREQAINEMVILAADSLYPDVHASSPISLQQLDDALDGRFHLASLQCLLQKEVNTGRLIIEQQRPELVVGVLPPELADGELREYANTIIYKSTL